MFRSELDILNLVFKGLSFCFFSLGTDANFVIFCVVLKLFVLKFIYIFIYLVFSEIL